MVETVLILTAVCALLIAGAFIKSWLNRGGITKTVAKAEAAATDAATKAESAVTGK